MGALAGIVHSSLYKSGDILKTMLSPVSYRSTDDQISIYRYKNLAIGSSGNKSIASNSPQTIWSMIDGTIYNANSLRQKLKEKGYRVNTEEMAELVAIAYECWGIDFLAKLNGPFALAIFDVSANQLIIARDKMGIKPLYWSRHNDTFFFASELKSILSTGLIPQTPTNESIVSYLFFGFIPQDIAAIKEVNKLLPGYYLSYNLNGPLSIHPYWSYGSSFIKKNNDNNKTITSSLETLIEDSVTLRSAHSTTACFIDDSVGSATLSYYAEKGLSHTHTIPCTAHFIDEYAKDRTAEENITATNPQEGITLEDILNDLVKITWYLDEPIADPHIMRTWKLASIAREKSATTVLSSAGSEEIFVGSPRYSTYSKIISRKIPSLSCSKKLVHRFLIPLIRPFSNRTCYYLLRRCHLRSPLIDYINKNAVFNAKELTTVTPDLAHYFNAETFLQKFFRLHKISGIIDPLLYFEGKTALPDKLLHQYDRITAAHGLTMITPFLDGRIVDYMASIPEDKKTHNKETALILKRILKKNSIETFVSQSETQQNGILDSWLNDPRLLEIFDLLATGTLVESGYISRTWIRKRIGAAKKGKGSFIEFWSVLTLEVWMRLFINTPKPDHCIDMPLKKFLEY